MKAGATSEKRQRRRARPSLKITGVRFALSAAQRARGLIAQRGFKGVLLLAPCRDVHTVGMKAPIDVAFVDQDGVVLEAHRAVGPFRRLKNRKASFVLERFSQGHGSWVAAGDRVVLSGICRAGNAD